MGVGLGEGPGGVEVVGPGGVGQLLHAYVH